MPPRISLLHATYHRKGGPAEVRDAWLATAERPERLEYIVAMDADDSDSVSGTVGWIRATGCSLPGRVTAVRNWNAAAAMSSGDLLVVVADDLCPPVAWDATLFAVVADLDPKRHAFAVKVTDSPADDVLLRHPIVSRAFYARFGLFDDSFDGVYCDNDITRRAFFRGTILDGQRLVLDHRHPTLLEGAEQTASHERINAESEYLAGHDRYAAIWSTRERMVTG